MSKMKSHFTLEQCKEPPKGNKEVNEWYEAMCEILSLYDITTEDRVAVPFTMKPEPK